MHLYEQSTGRWVMPSGEIFHGYSGHNIGLNNPDYANMSAVGPIPKGIWIIRPPRASETTGPYTMNLDPMNKDQSLGRSLFRIHGDNKSGDKSASHGCIILGPNERRAIWASNNHSVQVI